MTTNGRTLRWRSAACCGGCLNFKELHIHYIESVSALCKYLHKRSLSLVAKDAALEFRHIFVCLFARVSLATTASFP